MKISILLGGALLVLCLLEVEGIRFQVRGRGGDDEQDLREDGEWGVRGGPRGRAHRRGGRGDGEDSDEVRGDGYGGRRGGRRGGRWGGRGNGDGDELDGEVRFHGRRGGPSGRRGDGEEDDMQGGRGHGRRGGHRGGRGGRRGGWNKPGRPGRENRTMVCTLPAESGNCEASMKMWFYNATSEQCELFTYGGCGGNANRFWNQKMCNKHCNDPCNKPLDAGVECEAGMAGRGPRTLYYYAAEENECREFEFAGCGGNRNRFRSVRHCEKRCMDEEDDDMDDSLEATEELFDDDTLVDDEMFGDEEEMVFLPFVEEDTEDDDNSRSRRALRNRRPMPSQPEGCPTFQCFMRCRWGFQKDPGNGCSLCRCNPPPRTLGDGRGPRACPPRRCRMRCEFGFQKDPRSGCETCRCNDSPVTQNEQDECPPMRMCRMRCRYGFKEEPETGCKTCECNEAPEVDVTSAEGCPERRCRRQCEHGFFKDPVTGCDTCRCKQDPTQTTDVTSQEEGCPERRCRRQCEHGFQTDPASGCETCRCVRPTLPAHCRPVRCRMSCRNLGGFAQGPDGCPICRCKDDLSTDEAEEIGAEEEEEQEIHITRHMCPAIKCRPCRYGHQRDENNCRTCECNPPPIQMPVRCRQLQCLRACPHGYEKDARGCATCSCRSPLEDAQPRPEFLPHVCEPLRCPMLNVCPFGRVRDENGCETCSCRTTPRNAVCSLPKVTGRCMAYFRRFYFDASSGSCKQFVYGGCQGNGNNFQTIQECQQQCVN